MGIGDIGVSLWGECEQQDGMHLGARGFVHAELIDPDTGEAVVMEDGATASSCSAISSIEPPRCCASAPATTSRCGRGPAAAGAPAPRVRCIGRTDDMLIVRGVNVFPSAVREVVGEFLPRVSGHIRVRPRTAGVKQDPPLPVAVELARDVPATAGLAGEIRDRLRSVLVVQTSVDLVPWGAWSAASTSRSSSSQ